MKKIKIEDYFPIILLLLMVVISSGGAYLLVQATGEIFYLIIGFITLPILIATLYALIFRMKEEQESD